MKKLIELFNEKRRDKIVLFLFLSFLTHICVLFWAQENQKPKTFNLSKSKNESKYLKIVLKDKPKTKTEDKMTIVDSEQINTKKKPKESKFLGKTNQTFDRQVVAKTNGSHKRAGKGSRKGHKRKSTQQKRSEKIVVHQSKKAKKNTTKEMKKKITFADIAVGQLHTMKKRDKKKSEKSVAKGLKNGDKNQKGLAQSNDFIEDIPLGDMTNLNTVEFKYYGFYHRIKTQLEQYWGRTLQAKVKALHKSGRKIAAVDNRITSLVITLDTRGAIKDIALKSTSGLKALDDAAIESFNQAGPFPNPPRGMVKNGHATIEWGFVVKS
jgi:protein TonB